MKLIFCSRCSFAIPAGHARLTRKGKILCDKCHSRNTNLWRIWVASMILGIGLIGFAMRRDYLERDRLVEARLDYKISQLAMRVGFTASIVAQTQEQLQNDINSALLLQTQDYQKRLDQIKSALVDVRTKLDEQISDTKKASELSSVDISRRLDALEESARQFSREVKELARVSPEAMDRAMKSVVSIAVHDRDGIHPMGSGVLYAKTKIDKGWRYEGFTAYHVVHGVFWYLKNKQPNQAPEAQLNPVMIAEVFTNQQLGFPNHRLDLQFDSVEPRPVGSDMKYLTCAKDYIKFSFTFDQELEVSELAADKEIEALRAGDPVVGIGIHPVERPSVFIGHVAALTSSTNGSAAFHTMAWPGMSGSPIFDRRTMKVVAILQRGATMGFGMNSTMAYCQLLSKIDKKYR